MRERYVTKKAERESNVIIRKRKREATTEAQVRVTWDYKSRNSDRFRSWKRQRNRS